MTEDRKLTGLSANDLLMMMNGTRQGQVLTRSKLNNHKITGGLNFIVSNKYDVVKYVAWLVQQQKENPNPDDGLTAYDRKRKDAAQRSKKMSAEGRDIGDLPPIKNPKMREECEENFALFCITYFPMIFDKPWSEDHLVAIKNIEDAVLRGGQFALAMPRGSGKTSLVETACIWALVYGHRKYVALIGATEDAAIELIDSIKSELENNDMLLFSFPEVCFPIRELEGNSQRAGGQTCSGVRTRIRWKTKEIRLPTIEGSKSSGSIIGVKGITGNIRGYKKKTKSGEAIRPDLAVVDDPQTDESAASPSQTASRLKVIVRAVLGLAGPGKKIACFVPCTVIEQGDVADQLLDPDLFPDFRGQRTSMLKSWPKNMEIWETYDKVRRESLSRFGDIRLATEFYKENRAEMDLGAVVSWEERFDPDEISALQNAMNLFFKDEDAFLSEYQNQPKDRYASDVDLITPQKLAKKLNGYKRGEIPYGVNLITAAIDVQKKILVWQVTGFDNDGSPFLLDYGAFPKQRKSYWNRESNDTYLGKTNAGFAADLNAALEELVPSILDRTFYDNDGLELQVEQMLIDCNWIESKKTIYEYMKRSGYGSRCRAAHGRGYGAKRKPMMEAARKENEKWGLNWVIAPPAEMKKIRYVAFDTNYWKSWVHDRFNTAVGGPGSFTLFGNSAERHALFCDQATAEFVVRVTANDRTVPEWSVTPGRENDFFDTTVMCCVAGSVRGVKIKGIDASGKKTKGKAKKKKRNMREEWERKRRERGY